MQKTKIALILAPCWANICPPLGLALLAAVLKKNNHNVKCFDCNIASFRNTLTPEASHYWDFSQYHLWNTPENFTNKILPLFQGFFEKYANAICAYTPAIIGFSLFDTNLAASMYIATLIKKQLPATKIIVGGPGCAGINTKQSLLLSAYKDIPDAIILGEAEQHILEIINHYTNPLHTITDSSIYLKGKAGFLCGQQSATTLDLNTLPNPDFSDFPLEQYLYPILPVLTSRGCIAKCSFCAETLFFNTYRYRKAEHILSEIENNIDTYNVRKFHFNDSLINGNIHELERFVNFVLQRKLSFTWEGYARVHPKLTKELLQKMRLAGCILLSFGIESGSQKIINDMRKCFNLKIAEKNLRDATNAGIRVDTNWVTGFPTETLFDFLKTLMFIFKNRKYIYKVNRGQEPCGIPYNSYLDLHREEFGISPEPYHEQWRTLNHRNNIDIRKKRLAFFVWWLDFLHIHHS